MTTSREELEFRKELVYGLEELTFSMLKKYFMIDKAAIPKLDQKLIDLYCTLMDAKDLANSLVADIDFIDEAQAVS